MDAVRRGVIPVAAVFALGCAHRSPGPAALPRVEWAPVADSVWTFSPSKNRLAPERGPGRLAFDDPKDSGWPSRLARFRRTGVGALPALPGGPGWALCLGYRAEPLGLKLAHGMKPNGVHLAAGRVSNYTVIMDLLWPKRSEGRYRPLIQTDPANAGDAEYYLKNEKNAGIGISGNYRGKVVPDRWHRIALSVQAAIGPGGVGQMHAFIDGEFVGGHNTNSEGPFSRWSAGPVLHLLTDGKGKTPPVCLASLRVVDRNLPMEVLAELGGPHAAGTAAPGPRPKRRPKPLARPAGAIAHRGNSCCAPENTIAAIRQAFETGAAGIEIDIRSTADGVAVLMHDADLARTTDGEGPVSGATLKEVKALDAGSWFSPRYAGEPVPTLAEGLREASGKGRVFLDIKGWRMGKSVARAVTESGIDPKTVWLWQNDNAEAMEDFRRFNPDSPLLWGAKPASPAEFDELQKKGVRGFDLPYETLDAAFIAEAKKRGMPVSAYTVADPETMRRVAGLGADFIETDFPAVLNALNP